MIQAALEWSAAILFAWLYARPASGLVAEWASSADSSYGAAIACIALYVAWQRRHEFIHAIDPDALPVAALAILVLGLIAYVIGQLSADVFLTRLSAIVVSAGIVWLLAGRRAFCAVATPLAIMMLAIPLPALVLNAITLPLQLLASGLAETLLSAAAVPVYRDGNVLYLPSGGLEVVEACSGLRSATSLTVIAGVVAWLWPSSGWRRALLVVAAVPIAIAANGFRIAALGIAVETWGRWVMSGAPHVAAGWLTFVTSLGIVMVLRSALDRVAPAANVAAA